MNFILSLALASLSNIIFPPASYIALSCLCPNGL
jgi:hypothetical protein